MAAAEDPHLPRAAPAALRGGSAGTTSASASDSAPSAARPSASRTHGAVADAARRRQLVPRCPPVVPAAAGPRRGLPRPQRAAIVPRPPRRPCPRGGRDRQAAAARGHRPGQPIGHVDHHARTGDAVGCGAASGGGPAGAGIQSRPCQLERGTSGHPADRARAGRLATAAGRASRRPLSTVTTSGATSRHRPAAIWSAMCLPCDAESTQLHRGARARPAAEQLAEPRHHGCCVPTARHASQAVVAAEVRRAIGDVDAGEDTP